MSTQLSSSDFQATIDTLQSEVAAGTVTSITLTDANTPTMTITADQFTNDAAALNAITGSYILDVTGVGALNARSVLLNFHVGAIAVSDSGFTVGIELDTLEAIAQAGELLSIALTGGSALTISPSQLTIDADALAKITGTVEFAITAPAAGGTVSGVTGHANTVNFTGLVSQFTFTGSSDGQSLTVGNGVNSYQLSGIQGLSFTDGTQLVIAQTPGDAAHVNTGNITELYSAALAREPDLAGLVFYQTYLAANPTVPLVQFAQFFLNSPEYTSSHAYAQSTAGDDAFITDSYENLLHRAPETGALPYYENVINSYTQNLTPGTDAYKAAQLLGHAWVLTYFSSSHEFLTDVQVTATNPASAQHWLVLA